MQILDYSSALSSNSPIISPFPSSTTRKIIELKIKDEATKTHEIELVTKSLER